MVPPRLPTARSNAGIRVCSTGRFRLAQAQLFRGSAEHAAAGASRSRSWSPPIACLHCTRRSFGEDLQGRALFATSTGSTSRATVSHFLRPRIPRCAQAPAPPPLPAFDLLPSREPEPAPPAPAPRGAAAAAEAAAVAAGLSTARGRDWAPLERRHSDSGSESSSSGSGRRKKRRREKEKKKDKKEKKDRKHKRCDPRCVLLSTLAARSLRLRWFHLHHHLERVNDA